MRVRIAKSIFPGGREKGKTRRHLAVVEFGIGNEKEIYFGVKPIDMKEPLHAVVGGVSGTGSAAPGCAWSETCPLPMGERDGEE